MSEGRLTLAATPIGNLGDSSPRLIDALASADLIYAEDTRRTKKLLANAGLSTPLRSLFEGNERERTAELVARIREGQSIVVVSDAGMPSIADPGALAVAWVRDAGLPVTVVPGPSAVTAALALSGFGPSRFVFEGFLPRKGKDRRDRIEAIGSEERAVVLFASPKRLGADLRDLAGRVSGDRTVAVIREMTKVHEEVWVGPLSEAAASWGDETRGEITLVFEAHPGDAPDPESAMRMANRLVGKGMSVSDAARETAELTGVSRRSIYEKLVAQDSS